jgi:PilZ domain-containing protein
MARRDKRSDKRVALDHRIDCTAVAVDGTWSVRGRLDDISETGAKFSVPGKTDERIRRDEFFLVLTGDGKVSRRCKIVWENNRAFGLRFVSSS